MQETEQQAAATQSSRLTVLFLQQLRFQLTYSLLNNQTMTPAPWLYCFCKYTLSDLDNIKIQQNN